MIRLCFLKASIWWLLLLIQLFLSLETHEDIFGNVWVYILWTMRCFLIEVFCLILFLIKITKKISLLTRRGYKFIACIPSTRIFLNRFDFHIFYIGLILFIRTQHVEPSRCYRIDISNWWKMIIYRFFIEGWFYWLLIAMMIIFILFIGRYIHICYICFLRIKLFWMEVVVCEIVLGLSVDTHRLDWWVKLVIV